MPSASDHDDALARERYLPRYATYPTAMRFHSGVGAAEADAWTAGLPPGAAIGVRAHVPFCRRLCAFCSCRTQRARSAEPVAAYADALVAEIARAGRLLPEGVAAAAIVLAGGSPTILPAERIRALGRALRAAAPLAPGAVFSVEVEPHGVAPDRLDALLEAGAGEAILGLQDDDPAVQDAIGREQRAERVAAAAARLRAAGLRRIGVEILYGLPRQTAASFAKTCAAAAALGPDRVTLSGYAHVPWMAKRQQLIPEASLPGVVARQEQFAAGAAALVAAGYRALAIDLFARPDDPLAAAAAAGGLRRDLVGYVARPVEAVLGFGAASISRFRQGYVQNVAATGAYVARVGAGAGAGARGVALGLEDQVRGRAIEMLICERRVDLGRLCAEFGDFARLVEPACAAAPRRFPGVAALRADGLALDAASPAVVREVAQLFDAYAPAD